MIILQITTPTDSLSATRNLLDSDNLTTGFWISLLIVITIVLVRRTQKQKINWETHTPYFDSPEIIREIVISTPTSTDKKKMGYIPNKNFETLDSKQYPIVKMPFDNIEITPHYAGRSESTKGYTENWFNIYLKDHFGSSIEIISDANLPCKKGGRPFVPDFVLIWSNGNKNIIIDLEIDEPYEACERTAIHCTDKNKDEFRDEFFNKRGWIVIRFAEKQIHTEPTQCCAFVAKVIASIDPNFSSKLLTQENPKSHIRWNSFQAKKWAEEHYREEYLGIPKFTCAKFVVVDYKISSLKHKYYSDESPLYNGDLGFLWEQNKHERDSKISFDPIEHRYFVDGIPTIGSVTGLIEIFFPEFDSEYWSRRKAIERLISLGQEQTEENIFSMQTLIQKEWNDDAMEAAQKGTDLHLAIENYFNQKQHDDSTIEFQQFKEFLNFLNRFPSIVPFRTEWRIYDEELMIAGTVDMLYKKDDGSLFIFDWKRSKKLIDENGEVKNEKYKWAYGNLSHLPDNSLSRYSLQLNVYKAILEKRYGVNISSMNLLVLHENNSTFHKIAIKEMKNEVEQIFKYALITNK